MRYNKAKNFTFQGKPCVKVGQVEMFPVAIILEPDVTDERVEKMFRIAKEYMEDEGYTGVDASSTTLTYDAGKASIEETEPTRNW